MLPAVSAVPVVPAVLQKINHASQTPHFSVFTFHFSVENNRGCPSRQPLLFSIVAIHRAVGADRDEGEYRIAKEL